MSVSIDDHDGVRGVEEGAIATIAREEVPSPSPVTALKDAIQRAVSPERVRFLREEDGMLIFRAADGIEAYTTETLHLLGQRVVEKLRGSTDPNVRSALTRNDRIGIA